MLQFIRDKSQGVVAIVIVSVLILSFALWGIHNYFDGNDQSTVVVKVNGEKITTQQFANTLQQAQNQAVQMGYALNTQAALDSFKQQVLHGLVMMNLLHQSAIKEGFAVSPILLELTLAKIPAFQENGVFSKTRFLRVLQNLGYSQQQFFSNLSNSLLLQQVQNGIVETGFSLPSSVDRLLSIVHQKRSFAYVVIPAAQFSDQAEVTQQQARQYYLSHQKAFMIPKKVSLSYVKLSLASLENTIQPTEQQLHHFYQTNASLFSVPEQWQIKRVVMPVSAQASDAQVTAAKAKINTLEKQLKAKKADFDQLAKAYPPQAEMGHAGWVSLLEAPDSVQLALIHLKKPGEISPVLQTPEGFELIQLMAIKPAELHPYTAVQARVKKLYVQQLAQKKFSTLTDRLSNLAFEHPDSLTPIANKLNLTVETSPLFSEKTAQGLFSAPQVLHAAFSDDVLNNGNNSELVTLDDSDVMILRVNQKIPAKLRPFSEVASEIEKTLRAQSAASGAATLAAHWARQLSDANALQQLASSRHLTIQTLQDATQNKPLKGVEAQLLQTAFTLPVPTKNAWPRKAVNLANGDSAVLVLTKVSMVDPRTLSEKERAAFARAQTVALGQLNYALYMAGLKQQAKIHYYQDSQKID